MQSRYIPVWNRALPSPEASDGVQLRSTELTRTERIASKTILKTATRNFLERVPESDEDVVPD